MKKYALGLSHDLHCGVFLGLLLIALISQCRFVHKAKDKCAFIRVNCPDEEAGLFSYLQLYYCKLHHVKPVAFLILVLWLGLLFSTIGIAASDFLCINLSTIASILGMSESMAGVTFLAFGNGSPDVFSTFAAMSTHSGSLAAGELIGAAGFITTVVAGSMALVRPFNVARKSFVRDVCFFIVAASFSMVFLADGSLHLWECAVMVAFYVFYVISVVVWHWYLGRRLRRKDREAAARGQFQVPGSEELEVEEGDDYDEDAATDERRSLLRANSAEDFGALERGGSPYLKPVNNEDDDEEGRDQWLAEISSNMRISRPQRGVRRNTVTPIRPSLIGALEFRAVLSSLQKSRNIQTIPINLRRYSDDPTYTTAQQQDQLSAVSDPEVGSVSEVSPRDMGPHDLLRPSLEADRSPVAQRSRAVSANNATGLRLNPSALNLNAPIAAADRLGRSRGGGGGGGGGLRPPGEATSTSSSAPSRSPSFLVSRPGSESSRGVSPSAVGHRLSPDRLAPPNDGFLGFSRHYQPIIGSAYDSTNSPRMSPKSIPQRVPRIIIPRQKSSGHSNPASPFPTYHVDSDSATYTSRPPSIRLPPPSLFSESSYHQQPYDEFEEKPLRWWPYRVLPPPRMLASTLFPTVYSWHDKNIWHKLFGVVAAPSVFLLAITLPVVDTEKDDDNSDIVVPESDLQKPNGDGFQAQGGNAKAISPESPSPEFEYSGRGDFETPLSNVGRHGNHGIGSPNVTGLGGHGNTATVATSTENLHHHNHHVKPPPSPLVQHSEQPPPEPSSPTSSPSSPREWNRWLVCIQIFTAPFFVVLVVWANTSDPLNSRALLLLSLYSLLASLVLLAILLLTTSPSKAPRHRYLLCFLGFVVSIAWISTIANEVVGVLKAFGVILGISDAILGLTIFAVGNSLGDLVADITVAKLGYPVMALSACFGGPMLNILLGIGISGLYMTITDGEHRHERHPGRPMKYRPYQIEVSSTLVISGATLLVTLVGLLIVVPLNGWKMDRRIGWGLVALWCVSTAGNLIVEVTGWGGDLA